MVNGNSLYGQQQAFTFQLAIAMAGNKVIASSDEPQDKVTVKSFQRHLAEALDQP